MSSPRADTTASIASIDHPSAEFPRLLVSPQDSSLHKFEHVSHDKIPDFTGRLVGSSFGWLINISIDKNITMFNPLTGACIALPPQTTMKTPRDSSLKVQTPEEKLKSEIKSFISKIIVHKDHSGGIVAVALAGAGKKLAIARSGDRAWTVVNSWWSPFDDVISHDGRVYAIGRGGTLVAYDMDDPKTRPERIAWKPYHKHTVQRYIVASTSGRLLQLERIGYTRHWDRRFNVYELNPSLRQWAPIHDLGDQALFVGGNSSSSVQASSFHGCTANYIYLTESDSEDCDICIDHCDKVRDTEASDGKYPLEPGRYGVVSACGKAPEYPPLWFIPELP